MRGSMLVVVLGLLAGCSMESGQAPTRAQGTVATGGVIPVHALEARASDSPAIAALPDRGALVAYARGGRGVVHGAHTWHPIQLSEAHALRAVTPGGELVVPAPDGRRMRFRYVRHIEHADGNWTWVGREPGALPGTEAIITFGETAVFGSLPNTGGLPLRLMMANGRTWLVETDADMLARAHGAARQAREPDFRVFPKTVDVPSAVGAMPAAAPAMTTVTTAANVVDLVAGYTSGFASRFGGQSGAATRLTYLVDVANQAYANSQVSAEVRLVRTVQVAYPEDTANEQALYDLTGVECTPIEGGLDCQLVGPPATLQPLHDAREQFGGDLVTLVRNYNDSVQGGCGVAWLNGGGGQNAISPSDEFTGMSVVSDSGGQPYPIGVPFCLDEALVHELGHNMGSQHDEDEAEGADNVLQQNEWGVFRYSLGYKNVAAGFYTVMAYGDAGQHLYRVFSNPAIGFCGGHACGVTDLADNARSLRATLPAVSAFRPTVSAEAEAPSNHFSGDFNGDGKSDILWRNLANGANVIWRSGDKATPQAVTGVTNLQWQIVAVGDFGGDGKSDILWRNTVTGANTIWKSANSATQQAVLPVTDVQWKVAGAGDFSGDGKADIVWRNASTGANAIWKSGSKATPQSVSSVTNLQWKVAGVGDFNNDGRDDIAWRNTTTGANTIWRSANSAALQAVASVTNLQWHLVGVGDFNGDGRSDFLWRNMTTGANTIWRSANGASLQAVSTVAGQQWQVAGVGDFNGDARADILWRDFLTGGNSIWRSASSASYQPTAGVPDLDWVVMP